MAKFKFSDSFETKDGKWVYVSVEGEAWRKENVPNLGDMDGRDQLRIGMTLTDDIRGIIIKKTLAEALDDTMPDELMQEIFKIYPYKKRFFNRGPFIRKAVWNDWSICGMLIIDKLEEHKPN